VGAPSDKYTALFQQIVRTANVAAAFDLFKDHYKEIDNITYHMARVGGSPVQYPFVRTTYDTQWVSYYLLNDLASIDPVVQVGFQTDKPFRWDSLAGHATFREMAAHAQKFGISMMGYSVPIVDKKHRRSLLSVSCSARQDAWTRIIDEIQCDVDAFSFDIHQKAVTEAYSRDRLFNVDDFSPRELECLRWIAKGKTYVEIAIILNISDHTVRTYLKTVRMKLGSVTLAQAVSKAEQHGLI